MDPLSSAHRTPVRVLVVDDQSMIRAGFAALLDAQEDIVVVGTAVPFHSEHGHAYGGGVSAVEKLHV